MMRFLVTRSTTGADGYKGKQPCEEAFQGRLLTWNSTGSPYSSITQSFQEWFVEFKTLDELDVFIEKYGKVVIEKNNLPFIPSLFASMPDSPQLFDGLHLLIYDAYIE